MRTFSLPRGLLFFSYIILLTALSLKSEKTNENFHTLVLPSVSSNTKEEFNGLDYYSGRIVKGFGFGFNQFIEEQIDGRQELESTPSLFYNVTKNFSFEIFNRTSMKKIDPDDKFDYTTDPISTTTRLQAQLRPFPSLQIFPIIEIYHSKQVYNSNFIGDLHVKDDGTIQSYGFDGLYITKNGVINPTCPNLKWMHYIDITIPPIEQGQTFISFGVTFKNNQYNGSSEKFSSSSGLGKSAFLMDRRYKTAWDDYSISTEFYHGFTQNLRLGTTLKYHSFKSDLWDNYLGNDNKAIQQIEEIVIEPSFSYILSDEMYNQLSVKYSHNSEESNYDAVFHHKEEQKTPFWNFKYGFHWLTHADNPSLEKVLANYKDVFGNRLAKGAFHLGLNILHNTELSQVKYFKIFETQSFFEFYHPQLQFKSSHLDLAAYYGISDFIEIGIASKLLREKSYKPYPGSVQSKWFDRSTWQDQFVIDVGNYVSSKHFEQKYGWYRLSSFDQYYKPLLQSGMFKGRLEISHILHSKADAYFGYINRFDPVINNFEGEFANNRKWQVRADVWFGMLGNIEVHYTGHFHFYSSDSRNYLDKDWENNVSISWQPYKALRFEVVQNLSRYVNNWDTRFSYYIDRYSYADNFHFNIYTKTVNTWKVKIISLF